MPGRSARVRPVRRAARPDDDPARRPGAAVRRLVGLVVYNWPLKLAAIALATLLYAGLVVSQSPVRVPDARPDPAGEPADGRGHPRQPPAGDPDPLRRQRRRRRRTDARQLPGDRRPRRRRPGGRLDVPDGQRRRRSIRASSSSTTSPRGINVQLDPSRPYTVPVIVNTGTTPDGPRGRASRQLEPGDRDGVRPGLGREVRRRRPGGRHDRPVRRRRPRRPADRRSTTSARRLTPVDVDPPTVHVTIPVFSNAQTKTLPVNAERRRDAADGLRRRFGRVDPVTVSVKGDARTSRPDQGRHGRRSPIGAATGTIDTDVALDLPTGRRRRRRRRRPRHDLDQGRDGHADVRRGPRPRRPPAGSRLRAVDRPASS